MKKEEKSCKCPHCNANMIIHGHRISKGLSNALIKFRIQVLERNTNMIHLKNEVPLTKSEFTNFQKLRYHGLVAKYIDPVTKQHIAGYWLLTKRGNQFCKDQLSIPSIVYTFRNKIVDKHKVFVKLSEVLKGNDMPYWDVKEYFPFEFADIMDIEEVAFDMNGQGFLNI